MAMNKPIKIQKLDLETEEWKDYYKCYACRKGFVQPHSINLYSVKQVHYWLSYKGYEGSYYDAYDYG